jgi:hypothetical protein
VKVLLFTFCPTSCSSLEGTPGAAVVYFACSVFLTFLYKLSATGGSEITNQRDEKGSRWAQNPPPLPQYPKVWEDLPKC